MATVSDLLTKMAQGENLSPVEANELNEGVRQIEAMSEALSGLLVLGSANLGLDVSGGGFISAGGGDIIIDEVGIFFKGGNELLQWADVDGLRGRIQMYGTGGNQFYLDNFGDDDVDDVEINFRIALEDAGASAKTGVLRLIAASGRMQASIDGTTATGISKGGQFNFGAQLSAGFAPIQIHFQGRDSGESSHFELYPVSADPTDPSSDDEVNVYFKDTKIVFQYNDSGTVRYKYLDLSGTGVTWVHTTSAP